MDASFIEKIRTRLAGELPGVEAQFKMAPMRRRIDPNSYEIPTDARRSAVLILLYEKDGEVHLPLILRPAYDGVHSGQIGLPGGQVEESDEDRIATALRETHEEIGIPPGQIEVLGKLSRMYIPPSNFLVQPVVGRMTVKPEFVADPVEVAGLIEAPLSHFQNPAYQLRKDINVRGGQRLNVPTFDILGHTVWGATAMMMSEFGEIAGS